jgi:hypothetical protein
VTNESTREIDSLNHDSKFMVKQYRIQVTSLSFTIEMPSVYQILTLRFEDRKMILYSLVNIESPMTVVAFRLIMTGEPIRPGEFRDARYVGTFPPNGFPTVHLFTVADREKELSP